MRRREFMTLLGGVAAWPLAARAHQAPVGVFSSEPPDPFAARAHAVSQRLSETGVAAAQPPSLLSTGFPDATNTGVPAGINLTPSRSLRLTTPGQVVSGLDISGTVRISADNVTLKQCRISASAYWVVSVDGGVRGVTIQDCEVDGQNGKTDGASLIYIGNTGTQGPTPELRILRCNIHGGCNGLSIGYGPVLLQDTFIHDLATSGAGHINGIQYNGGATFDGIIDIQHNHIENANNQTDCIMLCDFYGPCINCTINNNLLRGGGAYSVYSTNSFKHSPFSGMVITNNIINKTNPSARGYFYPTAFIANIFYNNVDEITGKKIPRP
jgi:hypothetical protein